MLRLETWADRETLRIAAAFALKSYDRAPVTPGCRVSPSPMAGELFGFIEDVDSDATFVVFRGSQGLREMAFWIAWNLRATRVNLPGLEGSVRQGFRRAFSWLWHGEAPTSGESLSRFQEDLATRRAVYFTGHSLGGAIAALAFASYREWALERGIDNARLITFGAPRLGDTRLQRSFERRHAGRYVHVVDAGDPIPKLPPRLGTVWRAGRLIVGHTRRMRFAHHFSYFRLFE